MKANQINKYLSKQTVQQFLFLNLMDLFASNLVKLEQRLKFETQSPEKYGKGGYAGLSYTPSKLADNILYKELSNQKRLEQQSSKLRQTQATNRIIQDRLSEVLQEKEGIQKTLSQQIAMYKKMINQKEEKNKRRISQIQDSFNRQMQRILNQREEQTKYAQSEKQLLQSRIYQQDQTIADLRDQLQHVSGNHGDLRNENEKLQILQDSLTKRLEDTQNLLKKNEQKSRQQIDLLRKQLDSNELQWQRKLAKQIQDRTKQVQNMQRFHRNELQKTQNKRLQEAALKNQQLKDLASTFEKQTSRLNGIIQRKQQQIEQLRHTVQVQKDKAFSASKAYQSQISNISHERCRFKQQLLKADRKVQKLSSEVHQLEDKLRNQSSSLQEEIIKLKKDLELNQISYMREVDKSQFVMDDMSKELNRLRLENQQVLLLTDENTSLHRELRGMKELLIESSLEMERCKEEFIRTGRQKDLLVIKLREMGIENQTLYRIKNERQQEARGWRQSYLYQKNQY